jgi:DNA-directed RNA polymerase alpha subunit
MNNHTYKRAVAEQSKFATPQEAIIDHLEMAIAHAYISLEGEDVDKLISKLQRSVLSIVLSQDMHKLPIKTALGTVKKETPLNGTAIKTATKTTGQLSIFAEVPEPETMEPENIISEESLEEIAEEKPVRAFIKTVLIGDTETPIIADFADIKLITIEDSQLTSRAKIVLGRTSYETLGDIMSLTNKQLGIVKGCGEDTVSAIISRMKKYYDFDIIIEDKQPTKQEMTTVRKERGPYKKKEDKKMDNVAN